MAREAAALLAGDGPRRVGLAVGMAPLAPGVVGEPLHHPAVLVGDDRDRAQVVGVEVARGGGLVGLLDVDADEPAADDEVVGPPHLAAAHARVALGEHPATREVERLARGPELAVALVIVVVREGDLGGAALDGRRLVVGGVGDRQAVAREHVALGVVAEGGVDHPARDGGDAVRPGLAGGRVAVGAHIRLEGDVTDDGVVGHGKARVSMRVLDGGGQSPGSGGDRPRLGALATRPSMSRVSDRPCGRRSRRARRSTTSANRH